MSTVALITNLAAWRRAVLHRDRHRCRWCGSGVRLCAHHPLEISRHPALLLALDNGLTLCHECHYYVAHHGHPYFVHGRCATSRRPLPGQLDLFARWPGPLFASVPPGRRDLLPPSIGSLWPGPQRLLFAV